MGEIVIKERLNVCFIGHVDSGKSTTVGNLAYQLGCVDQRKMDKLRKEAEEKGKGTFSYAFVTDRNEAERDRGITITTTLIKIETGKYALNVIDCPGHKDFIKNMVTGTSQADCAVVMVPSASGEFESAVSAGGTLKEHMMICGILGVPKLVICINKMDTIPAEDGQQERRYKEVVDEMLRLAKSTHPDKDPIVLPISGYQGINIIEKGEKFGWFKGWQSNTGKGEKVFTLEGALNYQKIPLRPTEKHLRMPLNDTIQVKGIGTVLTGQVVSGKLSQNQDVLILPCDVLGTVKSLEIHKVAVNEAPAGENCGFVLKITQGTLEHVKTGHVLSSNRNEECLKLSYAAKANILIVNHPKGIKQGYTPIMDCGTSHVPVKFEHFLSKAAKKGNELIPKPDIVFKGERVTVVIIPQKPCIMEPRTVTPQLGRLAIRDGGKIVGIGAVEEILTALQIKDMGVHEKDKKGEIKKEINTKAKPTRRQG